jgi:nucleotide-binding universal stress UspA family protein
MYERILAAIDLNAEGSWRKPLVAAVELARKFGAELIVLTVLREVEAIISASAAPVGYELIVAELENQLAARIREINAYDLHSKLVVTHATSIYDEILEVAKEAGADLIVIGSHRPALKDYLLGTNAGRVVRHASCSVLVARE